MRWVALACALGLAVGAAPASAGDTLYITGRVVDGNGAGVRGARVSFELHPNPEMWDQRDCAVRSWEIQCKVHRVAGTTDAAGRYRLPVRKGSYLAKPYEHRLIVTDRPSSAVKAPARTEVTFYFNGKSMPVRDLPVWRVRPTIDPAAPGVRTLHVPQLAGVYGRTYSTGPVAELLQGSAVAWRFTDVVEDREVDARTVEAGTTAIRAIEKGILGRLFPVYTSPAYAVSGGTRPLSRGRACATYGRDDAVVPLAGCKFTDGALTAPVSAAYQRASGKACEAKSQCAHPRWFRIDLGSAQPVGAVAIRGCKPVAAEMSLEGTVFAPYNVTERDGLLVGPPVPARYVRVDLKHCVYKATEVSVFAPS